MFILQQNTDQSAEWIETNPFGDVIATRTLSQLSDSPKINADDLLVILIPGQEVLLTTVELPKVRAAERARIAPFALEEQLVSDPESIYLAFGEVDAAGKTTVAVLNQSYFETQRATWAAADLHPRIVVPDFLAIAWEPETWTIVFHQSMALVRTAQQSGFTVDVNNVIFFLKQMLENGASVKPKKIIVWQENNIILLNELDAYQIPIETRDATYKNKWDTTGLSAQLNLLQGKYRPKIQASLLEKNWKICGFVAASWIVFLLLSQSIEWIYLRHEATALQARVAAVYQQLFPGSSSVLEPHFRTESLLRRYDQASHGGVFLKLYRVVGQTLLNFPDVHLQALSFQDNAMQLTVVAQNTGLITQWNNALTAKKLTVKQTISKTDATSIQAVITISLL